MAAQRHTEDLCISLIREYLAAKVRFLHKYLASC